MGSTIQQQNDSIEKLLFQPVQSYILKSTENNRQTELGIRGKLSKKTMGLINPEKDFLKTSEFNGALRMKQSLSNRYINDYNLYKVDLKSTDNNKCVEYNTTNCNGVRFNDKNTITIENSLRKPIMETNYKDSKTQSSKGNKDVIKHLIPGFDNGDNNVFFNDHRLKKSCDTQFVEDNILNNRFNIPVPVPQQDIYLDHQNGINTRELIRSINKTK